jgi:alanine racemase
MSDNNTVRATRAEIDLGALRNNVRVLARHAGASQLWAVVKANAYGHGAVPCARAALSAGASGLCVALTQEAIELRNAGVVAPIMVMSEQPVSDAAVLVANDVVCVAYNEHYIEALVAAGRHLGKRAVVHLKVDTGMHRVGVPIDAAVERARHIAAQPQLLLEGVMTHLATADDPTHPATQRQLQAFADIVERIRPVATELRHVHCANSAATLRGVAPTSTIMRAGVAMYGLNPGEFDASLMSGLLPVMTLRSRVSHVQRVRAGEGVSYGLRTVMERDTTIATLPLGYADGIARRAWQSQATVLVGGVKRRIVGVVTMDQMMVDCGDDPVSVGDDAVVFGSQGAERVTVEDWALALGTISYEVVCAVSARVPRTYIGE